MSDEQDESLQNITFPRTATWAFFSRFKQLSSSQVKVFFLAMETFARLQKRQVFFASPAGCIQACTPQSQYVG